MLKDFINELKLTIKPNLSEIAKARYIYIKLGKEMNFDLDYAFGNSKKRREIYSKVSYQYTFLEKCFLDKKVICKSLCYLYEYILKQFNIKVITITPIDDIHTFNIITTKDKKSYILDLQIDLEFIKSTSKTVGFATQQCTIANCSILTEEELIKIDLEIGYIKNNLSYTNTLIQIVKNQIATKFNLTLEEKFDIIMQSFTMVPGLSNLNYYEYRNYNEYFFKKCICEKDFNKIRFCDCFIIDENLNKKYILVTSIKLENLQTKIYFFNDSITKYINISKDILICKLRNGLNIRFGEIYFFPKYINRDNYSRYL